MTKKWADNAHLNYWKSVTNYRQSKLWPVGPNGKHLHRMVISDTPLCLACGLEEDTAFNFMCECPALSIARTLAFGKPLLNEREYKQTTVSQIQGKKNPLNHIQILSSISVPPVQGIHPSNHFKLCNVANPPKAC
jgi:hypothetical protein